MAWATKFDIFEICFGSKNINFLQKFLQNTMKKFMVYPQSCKQHTRWWITMDYIKISYNSFDLVPTAAFLCSMWPPPPPPSYFPPANFHPWCLPLRQLSPNGIDLCGNCLGQNCLREDYPGGGGGRVFKGNCLQEVVHKPCNHCQQICIWHLVPIVKAIFGWQSNRKYGKPWFQLLHMPFKSVNCFQHFQ